MTGRQGLFKGHFKYGKRCGHGTFRTPQGDEFSGEWQDGGKFFENTGAASAAVSRSMRAFAIFIFWC